MRRRALIVTVVAVACLLIALYMLSRRRPPHVTRSVATDTAFARVLPGQSIAELVAIMGEASGRLSAASIRELLPESECNSKKALEVLYFYREQSESFFVYVDSNSRVLCKHRQSLLIHID